MSEEGRPKIIVDDDWKSRVQAEKEALGQEKAPEASAAASSNSDATQKQLDQYQLPPANFDTLVSILVTDALAAMGQIPLGPDQKPVVMLEHAKHYIDLLGMLEEKTKGNLSPDESTKLTAILHELRMMFVEVSRRS